MRVHNPLHFSLKKTSSFDQVPDFLNARIDGLPVKEVIKDDKWLEEEFMESVQKVRTAEHLVLRTKLFTCSTTSKYI